jgi:bifunctional DNA-binding transcriptional regulator/antitoxin component of YhaV-PrlF toxin-antitoxin module
MGLMILFMFMKNRMKISKGGQISIPAPIRHRWATRTVELDDQGDRIVIKPGADDPIAAAEGALASKLRKLDTERLRRAARRDDERSQRRRKAR